jgi:2-amino-4-hydroxy-6-hydroxymethyldihydropteridine diphosphokinase
MRVGIALGSNLGDRLAHLQQGRALVLALPGVSAPICDSKVYETEPVASDPDAGAYLNAVIEVEYHGEPTMLLEGLQRIEGELGRPPNHPRNAPRTIDLDILYAGDVVLADAHAVIPHPRLHLRRFVLTPLADIRPELILPGQQQPIARLLAELNDSAAVELSAKQWK